ncbi:unnamed protein product, partial [Prorocentrum cordatum]
MAPGASRQQNTAGGAAMTNGKRIFNKWKHLPPKQCLSCEQTTHELDRDAVNEPAFFAWTKTSRDKSSAGGYRLCGNECYPCSDAELNEKKSQNADLEVKWVELRKRKVGGLEKHAKGDKEKVDLSKYTLKVTDVKSKFDQYYVEGSWIPLWDFVVDHKLPFKKGVNSVDEVARHIEAKHSHYRVAEDDDGEIGVEVPDEHKGVKRFRRGCKTSAEQRKSRVHNDEASMKDHHEAAARAVQPSTPRSECTGGLRSLAQRRLDDGSDAASIATDVAEADQPRGRMRGSFDAERSSAAGGTDREGDDEVPIAKKSTDGSRHRGNDEASLIHTAGELTTAYIDDFNLAEHWNQRPTKRAFQTVIGRLQTMARRCGALIYPDKCQNLSLQLSDRDFANLVFGKLVGCEFSVIEMVFKDAGGDLIINIFTSTMQHVADKSIGTREQHSLHLNAFLKSIQCKKSVPTETVGFNLVGFCPGVEKAQRTLTLVFLEKLWRQPDESTIIHVAKVIEEIFGTDLPRNFDFKSLESDWLVGEKWCWQVAVDIAFTIAAARVLETLGGSNVFGPGIKAANVSIVDNPAMVSARVRALVRVPGQRSNHLRRAWDVMEQHNEDSQGAGNECADADAVTRLRKTAQDVLDSIKEESNVDWANGINKWLDVADDQRLLNDICLLGNLSYASARTDSQPPPDMIQDVDQGNEMANCILTLADHCLRHSDHNVIMGDIANPRERQQAPEAAPDDPHGTVYDQGITMFKWLKMAMGVLTHYDASANSTVSQAKAITEQRFLMSGVDALLPKISVWTNIATKAKAHMKFLGENDETYQKMVKFATTLAELDSEAKALATSISTCLLASCFVRYREEKPDVLKTKVPQQVARAEQKWKVSASSLPLTTQAKVVEALGADQPSPSGAASSSVSGIDVVDLRSEGSSATTAATVADVPDAGPKKK